MNASPLPQNELSSGKTAPTDTVLGRLDNLSTILEFFFARIVTAILAIFGGTIYGANELFGINTGIATRWALYALITAATLIAWWVGYHFIAKHGRWLQPYGTVLLLVAFGTGFGERVLTQPPTVAITNPASGQGIEVRIAPDSDSGKFTVQGSCRLNADPSYRVFIILQPTAASRWYVQKDPVDCEKSWKADAYYGSKKNQNPPRVGDKVRAKAILARPADVGVRAEVENLAELKPVVQSDAIIIPIDFVTEGN